MALTRDSSGIAPADTRQFTVAEANASLPLVGRVVRDIVSLHSQIMALHALSAEPTLDASEHESLRARRATAVRRLELLTAELAAIGCELKDWESGLVDFPAALDGREVCLCWRLGETQVGFWHERHAGVNHRVALIAD